MFLQFGVGFERHASFPRFAVFSPPDQGLAAHTADIGAGNPRFVKCLCDPDLRRRSDQPGNTGLRRAAIVLRGHGALRPSACAPQTVAITSSAPVN
jgi:hypothetical protein